LLCIAKTAMFHPTGGRVSLASEVIPAVSFQSSLQRKEL